MKYLKATKYFSVNLAWLNEHVAKWLEKVDTRFQGGGYPHETAAAFGVPLSPGVFRDDTEAESLPMRLSVCGDRWVYRRDRGSLLEDDQFSFCEVQVVQRQLLLPMLGGISFLRGWLFYRWFGREFRF